MEPLRGGGLVNLSKKALDKLKEKLPNEMIIEKVGYGAGKRSP